MFTGGNNVEKLGFKSLLIDVFFPHCDFIFQDRITVLLGLSVPPPVHLFVGLSAGLHKNE